MEEKKKIFLIFLFTIAYLTTFTAYAIIRNNSEFLYYTLILCILILIILKYNDSMKLPSTILLGLSIAGIMHILGGNIHINGIRLYDTWLIEGIFRYDNLVHTISTFIAGFISYNLLLHNLRDSAKNNSMFIFILIVSITMGFGVINEILEFGAVVLFNAQGVGDYLNNATDIVFNLFGSILAGITILTYRRVIHIRQKMFTEQKK